jgi:hypothetical protein
MATRQEAYRAIDVEREYQDTKWAGHKHQTAEYLTMLRSYLQKADEAWTFNSGDEAALDVVRKIAAIAVHCMEENGVIHRGMPQPEKSNNTFLNAIDAMNALKNEYPDCKIIFEMSKTINVPDKKS